MALPLPESCVNLLTLVEGPELQILESRNQDCSSVVYYKGEKKKNQFLDHISWKKDPLRIHFP